MVQARRSLHRVAALAATALVCSSSTTSTASAFQQTTTTTTPTATLVRTTTAPRSAAQIPFLTTSRSTITALPMADSNDDGVSAQSRTRQTVALDGIDHRLVVPKN